MIRTKTRKPAFPSFLCALWVTTGLLAGCAGGPKPAATTATDTKTKTPAAGQPGEEYRRQQVKGVTDFPVTETATKDPAFLTPLPKGHETQAAHLPKRLSIRLPFDGSYRISNGYGCESRSWTHQTIGNTESANDFFALDIGMPVGTPVLAVARGRVVTAEDRSTSDSYGKYIVIDHGHGIHSIYAHLDSMAFEVDHGRPIVWVEQGQKIGESGKSGGQRFAHLHFAMHKDSRISHSGCDVGGLAVIPEPISEYYGIRSKHVLNANAGQ